MYDFGNLTGTEVFSEFFNIPDWNCPDTVKAPTVKFYEGLERN